MKYEDFMKNVRKNAIKAIKSNMIPVEKDPFEYDFGTTTTLVNYILTDEEVRDNVVNIIEEVGYEHPSFTQALKDYFSTHNN